MTATVLLVDDDRNLVKVVSYHLREEGHEVLTAATAEEALALLSDRPVDLVLTDLRMPGMGGMELLRRIGEGWPELPVILITAFAAIDSAVEAIRAGAVDYIPKPFNQDDLKFKVRKALEYVELRRENERLRRETAGGGLDALVGRSEPMQRALALCRQVAPSDATVLISGASGTGKELVARALHQLSPRHDGPFVALNCAAIPAELLESDLFGHQKGAFTGAYRDQPGKFELADRGTIFLDEIDDIGLALQPKLLRALQEREVQRVGEGRPRKVDVRVIAATKADLAEMVRAGRFRDDLYYRLNVIPIALPRLSERPGDVLMLADHFLRRFAEGRLSLAPEALAALERHDWPGNVRELENLVERLAVLHRGRQTVIGVDDLPAEFRPAGPPAAPTSLFGAEKEMVKQALARAAGNRSEAARLLGVPRHVLLYRLKKYGLEK